MNIWILQTGEKLHCDNSNNRPMRAINLSNKLIEHGHNVVLWSSSFDHQNKIHRSKKYKVIEYSDNLEIRLIPSPGYKKHIGFARLVDHAQMAYNLKKILNSETSVPDIAFIGYPPIETAAVMSKWLKNRSVPTMLDVKDLWPSIFVNVFPPKFQIFARILFHPYFILSKRTIREVNGISTMSNGFLSWCRSFSNRHINTNDKLVRLTSSLLNISDDEFDSSRLWWKAQGVTNTPKVFFIGTFSTAFDFIQIHDAAKSIQNCQFILCGHGPCLNQVKELMTGLPNVIFPGWIDQVQLKCLANISIATLAPYKNIDNFTLNIPNKIVDSLMLGLPILSPLMGEVESLISRNKVGFTYGKDNTLNDCIKTLMASKNLQDSMSINAKKTYNNHFEFNKVYDDLVCHLESMADKKE